MQKKKEKKKRASLGVLKFDCMLLREDEKDDKEKDEKKDGDKPKEAKKAFFSTSWVGKSR